MDRTVEQERLQDPDRRGADHLRDGAGIESAFDLLQPQRLVGKRQVDVAAGDAFRPDERGAAQVQDFVGDVEPALHGLDGHAVDRDVGGLHRAEAVDGRIADRAAHRHLALDGLGDAKPVDDVSDARRHDGFEDVRIQRAGGVRLEALAVEQEERVPDLQAAGLGAGIQLERGLVEAHFVAVAPEGSVQPFDGHAAEDCAGKFEAARKPLGQFGHGSGAHLQFEAQREIVIGGGGRRGRLDALRQQFKERRGR